MRPHRWAGRALKLTGSEGAARSREVALTADQKKEFIEVTKRLKLLTDRRAQILARVATTT